MLYQRYPFLENCYIAIPDGWKKAFVNDMYEKLRKEFLRCGCINTASAVEIKEKYGAIRIYLHNVPSWCNADDIVEKYAAISKTTCFHCGDMHSRMVDLGGWVIPCCMDCYDELFPGSVSYDNAVV